MPVSREVYRSAGTLLLSTLLLSVPLLFLQGCAGMRPSANSEGPASPTTSRPPSEALPDDDGAPFPLILISFDGFRWDYPYRYHTPHLARMAQAGVKAEYLEMAFPTKTFPNHYTIATGLYPGHHGIISNSIYDPEYGASFSLGNEEAIESERWWGGEPIWVTAEKQGLRAATFFWPGSEAPIDSIRPSYRRAYDGSVPGEARVEQVLRWLDFPEWRRPDLITLYFSAVDAAGHRHGPSSEAVNQAVASLDTYLGQLYSGLEARGWADSVNVVVTSDHGMAALSRDRVIFLDDYLTGTGDRPRLENLRVTEHSPVLMAWPDEAHTQAVLDALKGAHPKLSVYHKSEVPEELHFSGSRRIPPIIGIAEEGWSVSTHAEFEAHPERFTGGAHGYVPSAPTMRGILYARGPAFARRAVAPPQEAIDLYRLMCHLLHLNPAPGDGDDEAVQALLKQPALP